MALTSFSCCFGSGFGTGGLSVSGKKAVVDQAEVVSDYGLVCKAIAEAAGASLKKALATLDQAETELQTAQLNEYRDQVAIYETFVGQIRQNKTMPLQEAAKQLKAKAAPVIAAHEQLAETTACLEVEELTDSSDDRSRDTSKDDGPEKADS